MVERSQEPRGDEVWEHVDRGEEDVEVGAWFLQPRDAWSICAKLSTSTSMFASAKRRVNELSTFVAR